MSRQRTEPPISTHAALEEALRAAASEQLRPAPSTLLPRLLAELAPRSLDHPRPAAIPVRRLVRVGALVVAAAIFIVIAAALPLLTQPSAPTASQPDPKALIAGTFEWSRRSPGVLAARMVEPVRREADSLALSTRRAFDLLQVRLPGAPASDVTHDATHPN